MSYTFCTGCNVELRQAETSACDFCWREGMGKSPRLEWRKLSDETDVVSPPPKKCDYCHHRSCKWLAHATLCNSCHVKENITFKEDVVHTLQFLREFHPAPSSKEFEGDLFLVVNRRNQSPHHSEEPHDTSTSHDHETGDNTKVQPQHSPDQPQEHGDIDPHPSRLYKHTPRGPIRTPVHSFMLASRSSVFRKILETQAKEKAVADLKERYHLTIHGPTKEGGNDVKFSANKGKTPQMEIHIESNVSASALRAIIGFLYTAQIHFSEKVTPLAVMTFAHDYDIQWLKMVCESELAKNITTKNLSEMLRLSYRLKAEHLKTAARKFFEEHPDDHYDVLDALLSSRS